MSLSLFNLLSETDACEEVRMLSSTAINNWRKFILIKVFFLHDFESDLDQNLSHFPLGAFESVCIPTKGVHK